MKLPAYCILRAEKLTSFGSISGSAMHTFREIPTPNADASRTHLNKTFGAQDAAAVRAAIKARLPAKRRKDAVLAIEYLVTASPEWFRTAPTKQQNAYFAAAVRWLEARHGKENIVCVNMQLDETSPHLVAYVVPLTKDGRLSAKDFLGGRNVLREMQTDFAEKIGKPVGLQRGIEGSKATHTTAKQYAAALQKNPALAPPVAPAPTVVDRLSGRARRMEEEHAAELAAHLALVEQARNITLVSAAAREAQARAIEEQRRKTIELEAEKEEAEKAAEAARVRSDRLARENQLLLDQVARQKQEFSAERSAFQEKIASLKDALKTAIAEIRRLAARVIFLEDRLFPKRNGLHMDGDQNSGPIVRP